MEIRLGNIIEDDAERDAVHIAILPVTAIHTLWPGQRVTANGESTVQAGVGIVDPFLSNKVQPGERFWLFMFPNTITSLRHEWTHPEVDKLTRTKSEARRVIERYAEAAEGQSVKSLLDEIRNYLDDPSNGSLGYTGFEPDEEFWQAYQTFTGIKVDNPPTYFRCAC